MSKNNTPNQEPRGTKRVRLDQEEGNGQAQKKSKGNIEELNNRLFEICKSPNPDIGGLRSLIAEGADVNAKTRWGETPLHKAAEYTDNIGVIRILIEKGADVNAINKRGDTPLHKAAGYTDNIEVIRTLIEKGADVNAINQFGATPLHKAAERVEENGIGIERLKLICKLGGDIHARDISGDTPLHKAAEDSDNLEVIRILIEKGANVNAINQYGDTPLHKAAERVELPEEEDNVEFERVKLIYKLGGDIHARNGKGETPLHKAYMDEGVTIRFLVKNGADVNAKDYSGKTVLHNAAEYCYTMSIVELLELGADVNALDNKNESAIHYLVQSDHDIEYLKILLDALVNYGVDINARNSEGETALCMMVKLYSEYINRECKIEKYLVELGADVSIVDSGGRTALSYSMPPELKEFLDSGYHIQSDALFNYAHYNLPEEVAGDSRVYTRYINLLKREGVKDVFVLLGIIEENETISGKGQEIIHAGIGDLIEDFLMDFASLLHHAEGIEATAPLSLMIENPVGKDSPERDALVEYYNQQAAKYGVNFSCDLMSATTEEITPQDQMLLKQGIFRLNAKILAENAANWYFSNADVRKVLGHIVCHDSKILSFETRQKLQQIDAQYKEYEGNAIMQFVTGKHEQEIEVLKAQNQMLKSILEKVCGHIDMEFDFTPEGNLNVDTEEDIDEDIEEEVQIEEKPIQEVEEKPSLDLFAWLGDEDSYTDQLLGDMDWVGSDSGS